MIQITDKSACCGCSACVNVCPKQCISFNEDVQGFLYPSVNTETCINCGLCEKVCPIIRQGKIKQPLKVYAAKSKNETVRLQSSSGGVFSILAENVINCGGVVFGAKFDKNWEVYHDFVETIDGLSSLRGSKYVQSRIGDSYLKAEMFLKQGREVLFCGTPCQIAGLKNYLRKEYSNLLAVDFVCHGVPSPLIWREYLKTLICQKGVVGRNMDLLFSKEIPVIIGVDFRNKAMGWKKYGFTVRAKSSHKVDRNTDLQFDKSEDVVNQPFFKNVFMQGFLQNLYLRPSCYACPSKNGKSGADITLGDFWGIEKHYPEFDDDKGCGLILLNTLNLNDLLAEKCDLQETTFEKVAAGNPCILHSVDTPANYRYFWKVWAKNNDLENTLTTIHDPRFLMRLRRLIYRKIGI